MAATTTTLKPAHGVFLAIFIATAVIWLAFEVRQGMQRRSEATRSDQGSQFVIRGAVVLGALGAALTFRHVPSATIQPQALASWLGLVFFLTGVGLRLWSFHTLGRYFTFVVQTSTDQPVISSGPYRYVRHPGYTGLLLAFVGVAFLVIGNWLSVLCVAAGTTAGLAFRINVEERSLLRDLGERYREYAAPRKRLIPYVW